MIFVDSVETVFIMEYQWFQQLSFKEDRIPLEYVAVDEVAYVFFLRFVIRAGGLVEFDVERLGFWLRIFRHKHTNRDLHSIVESIRRPEDYCSARSSPPS